MPGPRRSAIHDGTPRTLRLIKMVCTTAGANAKVSTGPFDLNPGWITRIGIISSGSGGTLSTMIHGRYYAKVDVTYGGQQHQTLWQGYCTVTALDSTPNIRVKQGDQINFNVWAGTNGETGTQIIMGIWIEEDPDQVIGAGWIYDEKAITGPGELVTTNLAQPAAGADYTSVTLGSFVRQEIRGFRGQLASSAAAPNRVFRIIGLDASAHRVLLAGCGGRNQGASITVEHLGGEGVTTAASGALAANDINVVSLAKDGKIEAAGKWKFETEGIDVGDQWTVGFLYTEEWARPDP